LIKALKGEKMSKISDVVIVDGARTAIGGFGGSLSSYYPAGLGTFAAKEAISRSKIDPGEIDHSVFGHIIPTGAADAYLARHIGLNSGLKDSSAALNVNRLCGSSIQSIISAPQMIAFGDSKIALAGGAEDMSRGVDFLENARYGQRMGDGRLVDMTTGVLADPFDSGHMGMTAELIATKWNYSRDDLDAYAVESQKRAETSWKEDRFAKSILPVKDVLGMTVLDHDEHMRPEATMQSLGALKASFTELGASVGFDSIAIQKYPEIEAINHVHHAGNSSGIVDGAAGVLVGSKEFGEKTGLKPRARIKGFASIGSEPTIMLTGPSYAAEKALAKCGMSKSDIDVWELNEAFAAVVLRFMEELDIDHSDINVCGGSIAMGHPLGATGAMVLGTVVDELERSGKETALATLCIGGGMGTATIIERV